jgi:ADP-ribose pyrophosphatase YjhB (NUDIX family)
VEIGERLTDATAREAREETGLEVETGPLVELLERIFRDQDGRVQYHYVLADYLCSVVGGSLCAGSDATEARWVDVSELQDFDLPDVTMEVIMKAIK